MLLGIHGLRPLIVNLHVRRLALAVSLAVLPGLAAEADLSGMLRAVEKRYNAARTVQILFQQSMLLYYNLPRPIRLQQRMVSQFLQILLNQ